MNRAKSAPLAPEKPSDVLKGLRVLLKRSGYNVAEWQAQLYEAEMVDVLAAIARDPDNKPGERIEAANSVLDRARGKPMGLARQPDDGKPRGDTTVIDAEVEASKAAANTLRDMQMWLTRPMVEWPPHVVALYEATAGEMTTVVDAIEHSEALKQD